MKTSSLLFTLGALLALPTLRAQADSPPAKPLKLIKVAELKTADAVTQFQRNVQILLAQRDEAIRLKEQIEKETDADKKAELKGQFAEKMKKLNDDNALMVKTYGFSIDHNYTMNIDSASIYVQVTDEEAKKIEAAQKAAGK